MWEREEGVFGGQRRRRSKVARFWLDRRSEIIDLIQETELLSPITEYPHSFVYTGVGGREKLSERGVAAVVGGVKKRHQRSARHGYDSELVGQFGRAHSSGLFVRHCVPSILRSKKAGQIPRTFIALRIKVVELEIQDSHDSLLLPT